MNNCKECGNEVPDGYCYCVSCLSDPEVYRKWVRESYEYAVADALGRKKNGKNRKI